MNGTGPKLTEAYFAEALIPALNRMGMTPVGAFTVYFGPETPTFYLLMPSKSVETLVMVDLALAKDEAFMKAAAPFWNTPAASPAFIRLESQLLRGFEGFPMLVPPASSATKAPRIFQLRTYESPTMQDHVRKVEMFHAGEFEIFARAGCTQVFYGDSLIGARLPSLTYMLTFPDTTDLEVRWKAFSSESAVEEALLRPALRLRAYCLEYRQPDSQTALVFSDLACSATDCGSARSA